MVIIEKYTEALLHEMLQLSPWRTINHVLELLDLSCRVLRLRLVLWRKG